MDIQAQNLNLFDIDEQALPEIDGLEYTPDFISAEEESTLFAQIDQQPWLNDLKRRVQHYGYKYDYKARTVTPDSYLGELPEWLMPIIAKLPFQPDQAIVNEYLPGQGISAHIDCQPCFGDTIASLSLGSAAMMQFAKDEQKAELYLASRSLITLSRTARYQWTHAIPTRKSDIINGHKIQRARRVSVTFRTMLLNQESSPN